MEKRLFSNSFFKKIVAVIATVAIMLAVAPFAGIFDLALNASAETPVYDQSLGQKQVNGSTLTAVPNAGIGFRGWFLADGTEVSYEKSITIEAGKTASDYIPVFYDFNLINNGGFEGYEVGTNFKTADIPEDEMWKGVTQEYINGTEADSWAANIKVTDAAYRSGTKSIVLNSPHHLTYKELNNLEPNTLYTLTYYFNMVSTTAENDYLKRSYIVGGDLAVNELLVNYAPKADMKYLDVKDFDATSGSCAAGEWKEVKHTFFTGDNTSAKLLIYYRNEPVDGVRPSFYIDDVSLFKDNMLSPSEYFNDSFDTNSTANWTKLNSGLSLAVEQGVLNVSSNGGTQMLQSSPLFVKEGATYEITFDYKSVNVEDDNGFNISLSTAAGQYGYGGYYFIEGEDNFANSGFGVKVKQGSTEKDAPNYDWEGVNNISRVSFKQETYKGNFFGMGKITLADGAKVTISFKALKNSAVYLNTWLDEAGTYSIDNLAVSETNVPLSSKLSSAVKVVGTAIRTEGKQGMRYKTQIDKKLLTADNEYGIRVVEYGTLAIKASNASGEITPNTPDVKTGVAYSFADKIDKVFAENNGSLHFTGVLINIAEENYNADYTVRAYFKYVDTNGNEGIFYADQNDIAVYPVSKAAYSARNAKGDLVESAEVREYLYNKIIKNYTDKNITISNTNSIYNNFQGIRSTVYHGTVFFEDSHGRKYTDAQAAIEMDRLVSTKVDNVRTRFDSNWAWDAENNVWDWNSEKMQAFYKWAKMLNDRNISITLQAGWHLYDFICFYNVKYGTGITDTTQDPDGDGHSSIPEVDYLHGVGTNAYGEDAKADAIKTAASTLGLNLNTNELTHYSVAAARYGEWIKQGIEAIRANGGNVEFVLPFTESGDVRTGDATFSYDEWIIMTIGLQNALTDADLRSSLKLVGPAQSIYANQNRTNNSMLEYVYSKIKNNDTYKNMIDINAMHQYTRPNWEAGMANTVYDPEASYSLADENFTYYNNVLTNAGLRNQEFWCDEYFAHAPDAKWWDNVGMQMTQFAAGLTAGINNGVNRFLTWQMFDTLWDADRTHTGGEFIGGVHAVGTCPSLIKADGDKCTTPGCPCRDYTYSSYTPRVTYYGINLIGKYMNNKNASVFATAVANGVDTNGGIFVSSIKNDAGKTVILVVNTNSVVSTVDIALERAVENTFKRYTYDPNEVVPTAEAKSITSDKEISLEGNSFFDVIPAQSFAIYVEGDTIGDTNIDTGDWWN
ncbi:MAG: hypothetical protein J6C29_03800 [Clostridia bacterium]|nr:hypothetical protein [Clostridia bacterium]